MKDVTPSGITWRNDGTGLGDDAHGNVLHDCVHRVQGAKKDKNAPRKPVIMKDSASSTSIAKIQYGFSEGTIWGLVDGAKSVILDGTPLEAIDGTKNFKNVTYDIRLGTNDQTYMKGFPDVSNEVGIGVELKGSAPYVRAINDTQLSAVRVRLRWNGLSSTNSENGDVSGHRIDYAIDLQTDGGAYVEVLNTSISDKVSTGYERTHRIELPRATGGWQIRIRRLTANSTSEFIRDTMYVDAIAEVIDAKFNYPNTAHMGIEFDSEIFRGIPKLEAHVRGLIIRVPTNYDPVTRTYIGMWDGLFKEAYTNNPAWIYYDIITAKRYGLGDRINPSMVDKWTVYALGVYCDQLVPDGLGGQEPRFTCNVYLQKTSDAYQVLSSLSGVFRAMAFWNGERIVLDADMPKDPVYTFSRANVIADENGICFNHTGSRFRDRHTVVKVAWDNPANAFQTEYEYIRDEKAISKYGIRVLDLSAFACTSQGQAQRAGLWALQTEQLETRQITFSVGLDGFLPQVADVVNVADELFAGRANSGRVSAISAGQFVVTLDRDITVNAGDILIINGSDGKAERRVVKSAAGRKVTMVAAFTKAEQQNIWALETADLKLMRFRIMSIQENSDSSFNITALQHEPKKFSAIDFGADVIPDNITSITPDVIEAPSQVTITTRHRVVQGQTITTLVINWSQVKEAVGYDVEWRKDDGNWIRVPRTGNTSVEIEGVYAGRYTAQVRSISAYDVASPSAFSAITEVKGKVGLPPNIVGLTATGILFGFDLNWSFGAGSGDAAFTEIQVATTPNVNVKQLGLYAYNTNKLQINGLMGNLSQSFRARLVDKLGFTSAWSTWVTGTTSASAAPIMDMIQGQINESSLNQALTSKIGKIETNSSFIGDINTELNKAKADIAAADKVIADNKTEAANAVAAANTEVTKAKAAIVEANKVIAANKLEATNAVAATNIEVTKAKADIVEANKIIAANKLEATNAVAAANKAIADNKLIASNAVAAANTEIAASKVIIDSNKAEITASRTELNTAKTQLATAIADIGTANTKIADSKLLIDANKAKLVLTDAEVAAAKTKVTALETDYDGNKTSVSDALTVLTNKDKSLASDISTLTASYGASETKLVQDLKVLADKDAALTNSVTTLSSNYEANKSKVAIDITSLVDKDTALNNLLTTLDSDYKTNKASVSNSLTTLTNKDIALTSDISKLNTKTDNTNAEIVTVKGLVSNNTSSIATAKTDLTAAMAVNTAAISAESVARADADKTITASVTTLKSDYDANKASVTNSLSTLTTKDIALTNQLTDLTSTVGTNTANITDNHSTLVAEDKAIADSVTALDTKYEDNKTAVSNSLTSLTNADIALGSRITTLDTDYKGNKTTVSDSLTALSNADTALGSRITTLDTDYKGNKTAIRSELTAVSNKTNSTATSLTALTTEVGKNKTAITTEATTRSTEDTALSNRITTVSGKTDNALSRITTAETTIASNTGAITQQKTDITAAYKQAIDDIEIGGRNLLPSNINSIRDYALGQWKTHADMPIVLNKKTAQWVTIYFSHPDIVDGKEYVLSFSMRKVSGIVTNIGGHSSPHSTGTITIDGDIVNGQWASGVPFPDDTEWHIVSVVITKVVKGSIIYIQVDRGRGYTNESVIEVSRFKLEKGNKVTDWTPAPEDIDSAIVANTASIGSEATARADADKAITSSVTTLKSDYDTNKASVTSSLSTLTTKDTALTNSLNALTTRVGTAESTITTNNTALVNKDTALTNSLNALTTDYNGNKTTVSNSLTALSTADTALGKRITDTDAIAKNAQSRVGTAETTISNNTSAIATTKTDVTAAFKAIEDIEADYNAKISTEATARSTADTTLTNLITTLDTDYKGNKTAIRSELTAVSNKTNSTATSLGTLTTTVGNNTTKISQESTARSTADTALGNRITATDAIAKNAQSRVGTAETAISNANSAIATLRTDLVASYTVQDTRNTDELPSYYYTNFPKQTVNEFKRNSTLAGVVGAGNYVALETKVKWSDQSGGSIIQTAITDDNRVYIRTSASATAWGVWIEQEDVKGSAAKVEAARKTLDSKINATDARVTAEKKVAADATSAVASTVGTLTTTVGNNTTKISQESTARSNADTALGNRITATDAIAKNAQSRVGTAETAISNANSAIATTKTDVTAAFKAIDDIEIGGRNFIDDSNFSANRWRLGASNPSGSNTLVTGEVIKIWGNSAEYKQWQYYSNAGDATDALNKITNGTYTFSVEIRLISGTPKAWFTLREQLVGGNGISYSKYVDITNSWVRYSNTFDITIPSDWERWRVILASSEINTVEFRRPKIEKGNKATDWSPAPEDIEASITTESTARSTADTALSNRITTAQSKADSAFSKITTAESTIASNTQAIASNKESLLATSSGINLLVKSRMVSGYYSSNGTINTASNDMYDPTYYRISGGDRLTFRLYSYTGAVGGGGRVIYYNSKREVIGSQDSHKRDEFKAVYLIAPEGSLYFRHCIIGENIKAMFERGNSASPWEESSADTYAALEITKTVATNVNGKMEASYVLRTDVGGRVSGFGLMSNTSRTDFAVNADYFWIAPPTGTAKGTKPFMVLTSSKTINGVTVPAGTYIESAFIHNGSIDVAKINKASINNLSALSADLGTVTAGSININNKFKVDRLGNMTAVGGYFSGEIAANSIDVATLKRSAWMPRWKVFYSSSRRERPDQFTATDLEFAGSEISMGSIDFRYTSKLKNMGAIMFEMEVDAAQATVIKQKIISCSQSARIYFNGVYTALIDSSSFRVQVPLKPITSHSIPMEIPLPKGKTLIQVVFDNIQGGDIELAILGDIINNTTIKLA